ncbi:AAA family ATPase, partial [Phaeobacter sp. 11ANDIMAR09]|uniref:AAA family ATPase n=1 Tax=Phaeobacter sp. 11ANDIMAR09 TaxID=1225647 RepID=UPI0006D6C3D9
KVWRGCRVYGGAVLYIAAEGGAGVRNRLAAYKHVRPDMGSAPFTLLPISLDLHSDGDALAVCKIIANNPLALVVVDTVSRSLGAGDENTAKDTSMFVKNCDLIREATGAHVMVIHHTGKDEDRGARGSSALRAAVDTEINVTSRGEIVCKKQRDMLHAEPLHFTLRPVTIGRDEDGEPVTSAVVEAGAPATKQRQQPKGKDAICLRLLCEALLEHGETKAGGIYPENGQVVHLKHWRDACAIHGLTKGQSENSARMAFKRAKDNLTKMGEIYEWGDYVWKARDSD